MKLNRTDLHKDWIPRLAAVVLAGLLAVFAWISWENARAHLFRQLDSLLPADVINTRLMLNQADHQLSDLITSARDNHSPWLEWLTRHQNIRSQYSQLALYDGNGVWIAGTPDISGHLATPPQLSVADRLLLTQTNATRLAATTDIHGAFYLSPCRRFLMAGTERFMCLLISSASDTLQWQQDITGAVIGSRLVRADGLLLMASPLSIHYQRALGNILSPQLMQLLQQPKGELVHFFNVMGVDFQRRLGVSRYDPQTGLYHVLSVPLSSLVRNWLGEAKWLFLLWLISSAIVWYLLTQRVTPPAPAEPLAADDALPAPGDNNLMALIRGAVYRLHLPEHRLEWLQTGGQDIFPADFSDRPALHSLLELIHADDQQQYLHSLDQLHTMNDSYEVIYRIDTRLHEQRWLMDRGKVIQQGPAGKLIEGLLIDITEHVLAQQHVEYLATRDPLTELMNRYFFNDELINVIELQRQTQGNMALLFIDLDRFKTVNDSLGHQVGDRMLKLVADRLRHLVGKDDKVARLGGDEFIVLMMNPENRAAIEAMADSILHNLSTTYQLDYYRLTTTCSIGITLCPDDSEESYILLRNADTAMYNAKARGGNCFQFYTEEMNQQVSTRLTLESELRRAIKSQEFSLHYQPQVSACDNRLLGAEALIRWDHPTAGIVSPADFIPIAEETGLIREIGDWALMEACRTFKRINDEHQSQLKVAVNVSVRQLDDAFVRRVREILHQTGLSAEFLELEITESLLMDNVKENIRILDAISQLGVHFAMDDFGTGYSSLSYLKQFPISKLKIDRAFVNDINVDPEDEAIVRAIIAMAKTLHLELVAEGVENHQQLAMLQALECDCYQGYYFSRPLPLAKFRELLNSTAAARRADLH
ncbi:putative bifunctional diguanylate cyclase/phosphodiesterase [Thalassolituus sp. LLYu03]|uniref:putative bifunctional diguanylate cyclase/phosphodiesterase n=1 Tax=Thalassolituus sp. LLYu03 TaxID=3421656 RepID=UPI003D2DEDDE